MPSLKMARNHLLISHYEGIVDDEEFLLLYDINTSPNLDLPYDLNLYERFDRTISVVLSDYSYELLYLTQL